MVEQSGLSYGGRHNRYLVRLAGDTIRLLSKTRTVSLSSRSIFIFDEEPAVVSPADTILEM